MDGSSHGGKRTGNTAGSHSGTGTSDFTRKLGGLGQDRKEDVMSKFLNDRDGPWTKAVAKAEESATRKK